MTGTTTGQTALPTATDSDDNEVYLTVGLVAALQALANLFESATGHDHSAAGKGKPIVTAGIGSGVTLTSPHFTSPVVDSGGLVASTSDITGRRMKAGGTALVNADFSSTGWGAGAVGPTAGSGSSDQRGSVTMTAGSAASANPTITLTFKDGTWTTVPVILAQLTGGTGLITALGVAVTVTATTVVFTMLFTPTNGSSYTVSWMAVG